MVISCMHAVWLTGTSATLGRAVPSTACVLRLALPFISRSVSEPQCPQRSTAISTNRVPGRMSRDNAQAHSETINKGGFVSFSLGLKSPFVEKRAVPRGLTHMKPWHKPPCLTAAGFDIFWIQEEVHLRQLWVGLAILSKVPTLHQQP